MDKQQREALRDILLEKRAQLIEALNSYDTGYNAASRDNPRENTSYASHMADQGTDTMAQEQQYFFASREENYLYHLEKALERLNDEDFGLCVRCGTDIGFERLEAVPHARLCIECKSREEVGR